MSLGCASEYRAVIHLRGGRVTWVSLDPETITQLEWGRILGDYSEASVTVAKRDMPRECFRRIADVVDQTGTMRPGVHSWSHELTIYRDNGIVWQGPIIEPVENATSITFNARDALFWNDRRVLATQFSPGQLDAGYALRQIMNATWPEVEDPNIAPHWRIDAPTGLSYNVGGDQEEAILAGSTYVGDLIRDICDVGIDQFTLGRKIFMVPSGYRHEQAPYRLREEHFTSDSGGGAATPGGAGGLEIREGGLNAATEGYVWGSQRTAGSGGAIKWAVYPNIEESGGYRDPWLGRVSQWRESTDNNNQATLRDMARELFTYGFPIPRAIVTPDGSSLSPEAPVSIGQLVPGRLFTVGLDPERWIYATDERFRLNEVAVTWAPPEPERVQISLVTTNPPPNDTPGS